MLHESAAAGRELIVELLLASGADPDNKDSGGHTPLYSVANGCASPEGARIVRMLIAAGGNVNACDGAKQCTPLHMAARRGFVELAEALLDCGANIEARDSLGHTPPRRAVNRGQSGMAALLVARGANPGSRDKKGMTPLAVAKTPEMRMILVR